jgi:hypothetical protein
MRWIFAATLLVAASLSIVARARAETVDVALIFAADVSRSVDDDEFKLQRQGYAAAITNPRVLQAIAAGQHGHRHLLHRIFRPRRAAGGGGLDGGARR